MTTTLIIDGSTATDPRANQPSADRSNNASRPRAQRAAAGAKLSFGGMLRAERIKLSSLRSIRFTLGATLLAGFGMSGLIAMLWNLDAMGPTATQGAAELQQYLLMTSTVSLPFIALVFGVLGVLVMSSEYASGLILSTLVAAPRRGAVFLAKAVMLAALAAITAVVIVGGGLLIGIMFDPEAAAQVATTKVLTGALGAVFFLTMLALFAFGAATLTRNAAAGIGIVAGVTFVAPIALSMLMITGWEWVSTVTDFVPTMLGNTLSGGFIPAAEAAEMGITGLSYGGAFLAMAVWAAVTVIPAAIVFQRRDAH